MRGIRYCQDICTINVIGSMLLGSNADLAKFDNSSPLRNPGHASMLTPPRLAAPLYLYLWIRRVIKYILADVRRLGHETACVRSNAVRPSLRTVWAARTKPSAQGCESP